MCYQDVTKVLRELSVLHYDYGETKVVTSYQTTLNSFAIRSNMEWLKQIQVPLQDVWMKRFGYNVRHWVLLNADVVLLQPCHCRSICPFSLSSHLLIPEKHSQALASHCMPAGMWHTGSHQWGQAVICWTPIKDNKSECRECNLKIGIRKAASQHKTVRSTHSKINMGLQL